MYTKILEESDQPYVTSLHETYWEREVTVSKFKDKEFLIAASVPTVLEPTLANGLSVAMIDEETGKYVGMSLNWCTTKEDKEDIEIYFQRMSKRAAEAVGPELLEPTSNFFASLWKNVDLFELYSVNKILSIGMISVDESYGGRGICQKLVNASLKRAAEFGIGAARAQTLSFYSEKAFLKQGFNIVKELPYSDFTFNGKLVFNPNSMGVHKRACIQCKHVSKEIYA